MTAPRNRWVWLLWLGIFLVLEVPAALRKAPWPTLSNTVWFWTKDWRIWFFTVAGLLSTLMWHLSPYHWTVFPLCIFGALFVARIVYVEIQRRRGGKRGRKP